MKFLENCQKRRDSRGISETAKTLQERSDEAAWRSPAGKGAVLAIFGLLGQPLFNSTGFETFFDVGRITAYTYKKSINSCAERGCIIR
jgi:hypothetical protein